MVMNQWTRRLFDSCDLVPCVRRFFAFNQPLRDSDSSDRDTPCDATRKAELACIDGREM